MPSDLALRPARERLAALLQSVFSNLHRHDESSSDEEDQDDDEDDVEFPAENASDDEGEVQVDGDVEIEVEDEDEGDPMGEAGDADDVTSVSSSSLSASSSEETLSVPVLIIGELDFADIQQLRLTSRFYHSLITKSLLKDMYGTALEGVILSHCHLCLRRDPGRNALLFADIDHPKYPFCSRCVDCAVRRNELVPGCRVAMGNYRSAWVCRWCGYPVLVSSAWNHAHFHKRCHAWYGTTLLAYLALGWLQFCIVIIGAALCLRYFRNDTLVLVPSILCLLFAPVPPILINIRRPTTDRNYHWSLAIELVLLGLWIAPTYAIASTAAALPSSAVSKATAATLTFCVLNLLFRLLNTLGNLILLFEFRFWRRKKPDLPLPVASPPGSWPRSSFGLIPGPLSRSTPLPVQSRVEDLEQRGSMVICI
ncbi:unnamed protein product [Parascedosporium putredinis]|uniref:F-box domain-containing protein n=1 Tax=Parascedosporium putredinis TaxID=1442378 RepID=A0A9P1HE61_9PEZI|nr:unnamed protein product [Parascedosporium putredinis]CAI8004954.1 unnamed protein product [Parascedosporium putredinis]